MVINQKYLVIWLFAFLYFCWGMLRFGLVIDTDDWGILVNSRMLLDGQISGDPNKTFSILVGLCAVILDDPWIFPIVSSVLGAVACLGVYRIIEVITENSVVAFSGWAVVLVSPVMLWQVLSCNSISFMTCFLIWALYFFTSEDYLKGCLVLSLASLARPEPIFIAMFLSLFMIWKVRRGELSCKSGITFILILGLPPLWWMGFNELVYGRLFYSIKQVHQGGQVLIAALSPGNFLAQFWSVLTSYYMNAFAAIFSILGIIFLYAERDKLFFLYVFFVVSFLGLWIFVSFNFALIERFLFPFHVYLVLFGVVFLNHILRKLREHSLRITLVKYGGIGLCLVFFSASFNFQAHDRIRNILFYHSGFDRDLPTSVELLKQEVSSVNPVTVLASARRISFLLYYLYDVRENIKFVSFREIYQEKSDWRRKGVDYVILAPKDMFPPKSAIYNFDLLAPNGLAGQGLEIEKIIEVSPLTSILKLTLANEVLR
jgi:hypothetical protein